MTASAQWDDSLDDTDSSVRWQLRLYWQLSKMTAYIILTAQWDDSLDYTDSNDMTANSILTA